MGNKWRALAWAGGAVVVLVGTVVVGVLLFREGLEDADRWASLINMGVTALIGVPLTLYQVHLARRALTPAAAPVDIHITAGGDRSIAAQTIHSASTGNRSPALPEAASPAPSPAQEDRPALRSDAAISGPQAHVRIEAIGERSIAAQNIGSASTGDSAPPAPTG
ncbi:hypothetical protein [Sinosporangium siamense]|uniref:hypothetical protein n=1 Tax=Sinosporangium siamense TaxID=1367973 RepID=UPI0019507DE8|nr:hypothetical protein [Sinosporangium siamense]